MSGYYLVSFLGALQGILLGILLLVKKGYHPAARMLSLYLLIFSVGLFEKFCQSQLQGVTREVVLGFLGTSNFLYGPLVYCFVDILVSNQPKFQRRHFYHMLPFIIIYGITLIAIFIPRGNAGENGLIELVAFEVFVIQILGYNILAIKKLAKHRGALLQTYSDFGPRDFNWLRFFLLFITGIYILSIGITHLIVFGIHAGRFYILVQLAITVSIYLMSYRVIFQPAMFVLSPVLSTPADEQEPVNTTINKYQRSGLKPEQATGYFKDLLVYMDTEKPYLDQELDIYSLAERLHISRNHLTQIINEQAGKNFYEFINAYRVEEVKRMMDDPMYDNLTIPAIGSEAGFKSKTGFNTNFKKITGLTPTEWKKNQQKPSTGMRLPEVSA